MVREVQQEAGSRKPAAGRRKQDADAEAGCRKQQEGAEKWIQHAVGGHPPPKIMII